MNLCNRIQTTTCILTLFFSFFIHSSGISQGWERLYLTDDPPRPMDLKQTTDGGFILLYGTDSLTPFGVPPKVLDMNLIKTDVNGNTLWTRSFKSYYAFYTSVIQTGDGGYLMTGTDTTGGGLIIKTDPNGNESWRQRFLSVAHQGHNSIELASGGYVSCIFRNDGIREIALIKTNSSGTVQWTKVYGNGPGQSLSWPVSRAMVKEAADGGLFLGSLWRNNTTGSMKMQIIRTDSVGDTLWTKRYPNLPGFHTFAVTPDGGVITVGEEPFTNRSFLSKLDSLGNVEWSRGLLAFQSWPMPVSSVGTVNVVPTPDGGYSFPGILGIGNNPQMGLWKTDSAGNFEWAKAFGDIDFEQGYWVTNTSDGGFAVLGSRVVFLFNNPAVDLYLVKTDSLGNTRSNLIEGYVFSDVDGNCVFDTASGDRPLDNWVVSVSPGPYYGTSDSTGFYSIVVDTGSYTLDMQPMNAHWVQTCPTGPNFYSVNFSAPLDTVRNMNFGFQAVDSCPELQGSVGHIRFRSCAEGFGVVSVCNTGTSTATNVEIELEVPPGISINTTNPAWTLPQTGSTYHFSVGNIPYGQCRTVSVGDSIGCNLQIGDTLCLVGRFYADSVCASQDTVFADFCGPVNRAVDPNEKTVYPAGTGPQNGIPFTQDWLTYTIQFQNTGTDTAFRVVIRDTLPPHLDPASVQPGASSHPYRFRMYGSGICEWTFDPIALPDSNVNLSGSQGFTQFRVQIVNGSPVGTLIENRVGIYFDYNAPVLTDYAFTTLLDTAIMNRDEQWEGIGFGPELSVFPNPARDRVTFLFEGGRGPYELVLYDLQGKVLLRRENLSEGKFQLDTQNWNPGVYLFSFRTGTGIVKTGKLILKRG